MKKRLYLLIPVVVLLASGLFIIPVKAESVNDPENDVFGSRSWTEVGTPKIDCTWLPVDYSMIDIENITWIDGGTYYNVTMTFYGTPNATLIEEDSVNVLIWFLIDGTSYPDDYETTMPEGNLTISSAINGTVWGDLLPVNNTMLVSGNSLIWSFDKAITSLTPVSLDQWDLLALANYGYTANISNIIYTYSVFDHYNYDFLEVTYGLLCGILELDIPGYSLIAIGAVSIITIGVIIKKKHKK